MEKMEVGLALEEGDEGEAPVVPLVLPSAPPSLHPPPPPPPFSAVPAAPPPPVLPPVLPPPPLPPVCTGCASAKTWTVPLWLEAASHSQPRERASEKTVAGSAPRRSSYMCEQVWDALSMTVPPRLCLLKGVKARDVGVWTRQYVGQKHISLRSKPLHPEAHPSFEPG